MITKIKTDSYENGGGGGYLFGMLLFGGLKAFKIMILEGWVDRLS